jgi:hypothetical protein
MKHIIINPNDIYIVDNIEYFKFTDGHRTYRDIHTNLLNNHIYTLKRIATICELENFRQLNKKNLVNLIEKSNCLIIA